MPPRMAWKGQTVRLYLPPSSSVSRVVAQVLLGVVGVEPEALRGGRADPPAARLDVGGRHGRERLGMAALASTSMIGWKIWSAWCVSSVGTICVSRQRLR